MLLRSTSGAVGGLVGAVGDSRCSDLARVCLGLGQRHGQFGFPLVKHDFEAPHLYPIKRAYQMTEVHMVWATWDRTCDEHTRCVVTNPRTRCTWLSKRGDLPFGGKNVFTSLNPSSDADGDRERACKQR